MKYAKGIMWLDDCRIPFTTEDTDKINFDRPRVRPSVNEDWVLKQAHDYTDPSHKEYNQQGRFTPNLLVCDDMLNDGTSSKSTKSIWKGFSSSNSNQGWQRKSHNKMIEGGFSDKGTNSRYYDLDKWFDMMVNNL